jgi:hypothetical protein
MPAVVEKVIPPPHPSMPEKAQIAVEGADHLYRELRIENKLKDPQGKEVRLKEGAEVELTVEADPEETEETEPEEGPKKPSLAGPRKT